jgi:preprotein translocase SecE subunit
MTHRGVSTKHSRFSFIGETIAELKKVVWLTRRETTYLTFLVLVVTIAVGIILGATDLGFSGLVDKFFLPSP